LVSRASGSLCGCDDRDDAVETTQQGLIRPGSGLLARRAVIGSGLWGMAAFASGCEEANAQSTQPKTTDLPLTLLGTPQQSGILVGQTVAGASIDAAGIATTAGSDGRFVIGFDRDAPPTATIVATSGGRRAVRTLAVAPRAYQVRTISGLPSATVNPPPEAMARIEREAALKARLFNSRDETARGFLERFRWPLNEVRVTSPWGAVRRLNGALQRPHYGIDLGGATGTPIFAPASGIVIMAEPDMHFEGGIIAIDHGQGLLTIYLHQSRLIATVGQRVVAGTQIGAIGSKGRATGPHLCWRMRWRGRQLDPSLRVG
jgi:murein DD-endopeptidase MepM/ murein hydrolase activator NlpD